MNIANHSSELSFSVLVGCVTRSVFTVVIVAPERDKSQRDKQAIKFPLFHV